MTSTSTPTARFHLNPMRRRDPDESGRTASTLELFFDLVFVIAVSIAAGELHHELTEDHVVAGLTHFALVFFAIWWAWMNFTWFATSFATDDWLYRVLTIMQMSGVLVLVAGVHTAALWWIYFWPPHHTAITSLKTSLRYGYTHYFVFAAAAALSAGIEVEIDVLTDHSALGDVAASFTVTVPIAIFVLGIWWIAIRANADGLVNIVVPLGAALVLLDPLIPAPVTLTAVILVLVVAVLVVRSPLLKKVPVREG